MKRRPSPTAVNTKLLPPSSLHPQPSALYDDLMRIYQWGSSITTQLTALAQPRPVNVLPNGAMDGNGISPLAVRPDNDTIIINGNNQLQARSTGGGTTVFVDPAGALDGDGSSLSPLAVRVDGVTITINGSNNLVAAGSGITQLTGDVTAGPGSGSQAATIANNAVTTVKILNSNVTYAKIQNASAGNVILCNPTNAAGVYSELAIGASELVGRGPAGNLVPIILGTNLSITSTTLNAAGSSASPIPGQNGYRLTLTTGVPVTTTDVTAAGTLYWTPYKGNVCSVYDGAAWQSYNGGQLSLALSITAGTVHDVFLDYNGGTEQLVLVAWSTTLARATALTYQDGVLVLTGATDHLYLGTLAASGTNVCEDSAGGAVTNVGGKRLLWNNYNRVLRPMGVIDTTNSWSYTTNTIREANAAVAAGTNRVQFVLGLSEDAAEAFQQAQVFCASNGIAKSGIGLDSTTTMTGFIGNAFESAAGGSTSTIPSAYRTLVAIGLHFFSWNECGSGGGTATWSGDNGDPGKAQSGLSATIWA